MFKERREVDDRVFLLGLDHLYREAMKSAEVDELLGCARKTASALSIQPKSVPVEGYYTESPELTEYFRIMRTLQDADGSRMDRVEGLPEYQRLVEVTSSPIFGVSTDIGNLLPQGRDALGQALADLAPSNWKLASLVNRAHEVSMESGDFSLVGLAAFAQDPVVLTATRESVVLYALPVAGSARRPRKPYYVWSVDPELARRASQFVDVVNELLSEDLPTPDAQYADRYWLAAERNDVLGRCVRIGYDGPSHYHWAIAPGLAGRLQVKDFWDSELWTTARYRSSKLGL